MAVDAYVQQISQLVAELQATRSPEAAVRRALERVGEQISGILQRAHETAEQITAQSRGEAEDRLEQARGEAAEILEAAQQQVATSTPTPTGSGSSAVGSSTMPATSPASCCRWPTPRPTRFPEPTDPSHDGEPTRLTVRRTTARAPADDSPPGRPPSRRGPTRPRADEAADDEPGERHDARPDETGDLRRRRMRRCATSR